MSVEILIFTLDEAIKLYREGNLNIKGTYYEFLEEIEGVLEYHDQVNPYSFKYTRDIQWTIKDINNNKYVSHIVEYGDHKDDLSLEPNGDIVFKIKL